MPGTYADMAALAVNTSFQSLVKVALLKRCAELDAATDKLTVGQINLYKQGIFAPEQMTPVLSWIIASTNATIGAAAPAVPSESDTQYAVNTTLPLLVR